MPISKYMAWRSAGMTSLTIRSSSPSFERICWVTSLESSSARGMVRENNASGFFFCWPGSAGASFAAPASPPPALAASFLAAGRDTASLVLKRPQAREPTTAAMMKKGIMGRPGTMPRATRMPEAMANALGCASSCPPMSLPRLAPSSSEATRVTTMPAVIGDEQRRDLADQAVADGEEGVGLRRLAQRHALLEHADDQAADDVDDGDDDAGDGVALDELHGAVHGAVELRLALEGGAAAAGLVQVEGAGAQVGVDAHLLAGHGVEGEARGHLGDALGALGDDDELDEGEDEEDDRADDVVAAPPRTCRTS